MTFVDIIKEIPKQEVKLSQWTCDNSNCNNIAEQRRGLTPYGWKECKICKKCFCPECRKKMHLDYYITGSDDYPDTYCEKCWELGKEYRKKKEEFDNILKKLFDKWVSEGK